MLRVQPNATPHIDALAAAGLRCTDFYMVSPVCSASRAGMMTGCYPNRVGFHQRPVLFPGSDTGLHPDEITIARYLKRADYATKLVGKWHCGDQAEFLPTAHGFDEYFGIPYSNDMGRQADRPHSPPLPLMRNATVLQEQPDQRGLTEQYTREALDFIDRHPQKPFFLYLAHLYVHVPLFVPKPFLEASANGAYGAAVACIDWSTGLIMDRLRLAGLLENTLVVFTSDNGSRAKDEGGSNAPFQGTKASTWEGGQRVPCIFHWPGHIAPGQCTRRLIRSTEFLPTFCALAGVALDPERPIDGQDISSFLLEGETEIPEPEMLYYAGNRLNALRHGDWKLQVSTRTLWDMDTSAEAPALYHLPSDPGETRNLIDQHPDISDDLFQRIEAARKEFGDLRFGVTGIKCRPGGRVAYAKPLTHYREDYPYIVALYDLPDMPTLCG